MALVKRGACSSEPLDVIVSESVCCCPACGHTDVFRAKDMEKGKHLCSKCNEVMEIISNSSSPEDEYAEEHNDSEDTEEIENKAKDTDNEDS
jgi:transcription initiation factor TFIIIB Brf1 subunit/transcription initiation factor TFIIB